MECPNCHRELKEGAKFCTHCGTRIQPAEPQPQQPAAPQSELPAAPQPEQPTTPSDLQQSGQGRVYWNIQAGQVARVITQDELGQLKDVKGVTIAEGTTAYIRVNGQTIATISGGSYDFKQVKQTAVNHHENKLERAWNFLSNLFHSDKKEDEHASKDAAQKVEEHRSLGSSFSVIVLVDKAFPLLVGARQPNLDDYATFQPMQIQTKYHTLQVGLNAYFKIADKERFLLHYLTDKTVLNTAQIVDEIADSVRAALQENLQDAEWDGNRVPDDLRRGMKDHLNAIANDYFFGLQIVRIVEITASNEDLDRFRQLSREMYLSEQELDYLRRTNDFKNRLAQVNNARQIEEARTELDLQRELDKINQDQLLRQDELDKFRLLYDSERRLREARTKEDEEAAMADLRRSQLVREDEIAALQHQMQTNTYQRGQLLQMMQLKDSIEYKRIQMEGDLERAEMAAMSELKIERARYDLQFEQMQREEELKAKRRQQQFEQFMAMEQATNEHELQKEREKAEHLKDMTWEQMIAFQGGEAAANLAAGYSDAKREREFAERMQAQQQTQQEQMLQILNKVLDKQQADQDRAQREMEHKDRMVAQAYDRSLNYTTRQNGVPPQPTATQNAAPAKFCPECGTKVDAAATVCPNCNTKL